MKYADINKEEAAKVFFDKVKFITLVNEWSDDHIPCATVTITLYDGTVHENVDFAYVGSGGIAALTYYDHPRAQIDFLNNNVPQIIESAIDAGFDHASNIKYDGIEASNQLYIKSEGIVLELAGLNIDEFEAE